MGVCIFVADASAGEINTMGEAACITRLHDVLLETENSPRNLSHYHSYIRRLLSCRAGYTMHHRRTDRRQLEARDRQHHCGGSLLREALLVKGS